MPIGTIGAFFIGQAAQLGIGLLSKEINKKRRIAPERRNTVTAESEIGPGLFTTGSPMIEDPRLVFANSQFVHHDSQTWPNAGPDFIRLNAAYSLTEVIPGIGCGEMLAVRCSDSLRSDYVQIAPGSSIPTPEGDEGYFYDIVLSEDQRIAPANTEFFRRIQIRLYQKGDGSQGLYLQRNEPRWTDRHQGIGVAWCVVTAILPPIAGPNGNPRSDIWKGFPSFEFAIDGAKIPIPENAPEDQWKHGATDSVAAHKKWFMDNRIRSEHEHNIPVLAEAHETCIVPIKVSTPAVQTRRAFLRTSDNINPPIAPAGNDYPPPDPWSAEIPRVTASTRSLWVCYSRYDTSIGRWSNWGAVKLYYSDDGNGDQVGRPRGIQEASRSEDDPDGGKEVMPPNPPDPDDEDDDTKEDPLPTGEEDEEEYMMKAEQIRVASRYGINLAYRSDEDPGRILALMDFCMAGKSIVTNGTIHHYPGKDRVPVYTLNNKNSRHVSMIASRPSSERVNQVTASLRHVKGSSFMYGSYPPYTLTDFETQQLDRKVIEANLGEVEGIDTPLALARVMANHVRYERNTREFVRDVLPGENGEAIELNRGEYIVIEDDVLNLEQRYFDDNGATTVSKSVVCEVIATEVLDDASVRVQAKEARPGTYKDTAILVPLPLTIDAPKQFAPKPTGVETDEVEHNQRDGTRLLRLKIVFDPKAVARTIIQWRLFIEEGGEPVTIIDGKLKRVITETPAWTSTPGAEAGSVETRSNVAYVDNVIEGATYEIRLLHELPNGIRSDWADGYFEKIDEDLDAPGLPTGGLGIGILGGLSASWDRPTERDWSETVIGVTDDEDVEELDQIPREFTTEVKGTSVEWIFREGVLGIDPPEYRIFIAHKDKSENIGPAVVVRARPIPIIQGNRYYDYVFVNTADGIAPDEPPEFGCFRVDELPKAMPGVHTDYLPYPVEPTAKYPYAWYFLRIGLSAGSFTEFNWADWRRAVPFGVFGDHVITFDDGTIFGLNIDVQYRRLDRDNHPDDSVAADGWVEDYQDPTDTYVRAEARVRAKENAYHDDD